MRVQAKRSAEPVACRRVLAEAALDHPAVEVLERVVRPEPERAPRVGERLGAAAVPRQRPRRARRRRRCSGARAARGRASASERAEPDPVVDVEERGLEVGAHAVRDEQPLDRADERVLLRRGARLAAAAVEVAERRDGLRKRQRARPRAAASEMRGAVAPSRSSTSARARARRRSRGRRRARRGSALGLRRSVRCPRRACRAASAPRPCGSGSAAGGVERRAASRAAAASAGRAARARTRRASRRRGRVAAELMRSKASKRLVVAAELDQRVAEHAVVAGRVRASRTAVARRAKRLAEP